MQYMFMFAVTVCAAIFPMMCRRWSNMWAKMNATVNELESQLGDLEQQRFDEMERADHLEEVLRVVEAELAQLRRDVVNHNEHCPLGRQITRSRYGARWHQDPNCQHLRSVDRDRIEHIYHCSSCSHARPLFARNI